MNLVWLNPALLAFTALIAVPVLAHLFAKAKPREIAFPSLLWLRQVERRTARLRKPKDWLLLALRTLAVAALVLAFLQPLLFNGAQLSAMNARKTMVLVVDRSASMSYVENGQSRLARGIAMAGDVLQAAGSQTTANLIWLDGEPDAAYPEPGVNVEGLRDMLRRNEASYEPGDLNGAFRLAMEQLGKGEGAKELYLISDFQASAWKEAALSVPPNVKVFKLSAATAEAANVALTSLVVEPSRPVTGTDARCLCRVRNFSGIEAKTTVYLSFGEARQSRAVTLPAWGEAVADFRVPCGAAGLQPVIATLAEDAFPADDRRFDIVEVRESWRVSTEGPAKDESLILWRRALGSLGWMELNAAVDHADVLLAVRTAPSRSADLRKAAENGALVICQPGDDWSGTAMMAFWGSDAKTAAVVTEEHDKRSAAWSMQVAQDQHPLWQLFASGEYGDPAGGQFWKRLRIAEDTNTLLRYNDGVPAVAAQRVGKGWLVLWNAELAEAHSNWVQQPSFLVLLGEFITHHGEGGAKPGARSFGPAQTVSWQPQQVVTVDQVRLQNETGTELPLLSDASSSTTVFRTRQPLPPGSYKWLLDGQITERSVVNFPEEESDLRVLKPDDLPAGETLSLDSTTALVAQRDGLPLWPWLVALGIVMLLMEGIIGGLQTKVAVKEGGAA